MLAGQREVPIIFMTGYGDVPTTVRAIKAGAYLSPREREVMERIVSLQLNKQVALDLGISEGTVKVHPTAGEVRESSAHASHLTVGTFV
jgi:FixJ family two-component response regulator